MFWLVRREGATERRNVHKLIVAKCISQGSFQDPLPPKKWLMLATRSLLPSPHEGSLKRQRPGPTCRATDSRTDCSCVSALSSSAESFLLLIPSGCWSSSLHVCIPGSRKGKGMCLATSSTLHITHISLGRNYTPSMGRKARICSLLSGHPAQALLLWEERALDIQSHLTASATHIFALMPSLFFFLFKTR